MMNSLMEIQEKLMQEKISKRQKDPSLTFKQDVIEETPEIKQEVVKEPPTIKPETETAFEMDTVKAAGVTEEDILKFRKPKSEGGRGTSEEFRKALKGRNPELQELANKVKEGKIPVQEYRSRADEIRPIRLVSEVPKPATNKEIVSALNSKQRQNPIIGLNDKIPEKDIVEVRLNIPAYTDYDVWIPTIRHNKKEKYKAAVRLKNVQFIQPDSSGSRKALRIAQGGEKNPFAVMTGEYVDGSDDELFNIAKEVFDSKLWTQVGYDPIKRGFFYSRETGEPVLSASEVVQVGHLVLAKGAKLGKAEDFDFNQGGTVMKDQMQMAFMNEGGMKDDGGETEPTSGNKVPSGSLKEEVADDIPAMLSEGEFVFPADVVRYIGLGTLMKMRQDAKQGLKMMEKMGQLGNPEEAEIPDDIPFGMADLIVVSGEMKDKEEKAEGGAVGLANGGSLFDDPRFQTADTGQPDPTVYTPEEAQEIGGALDQPIQPSDIQIKKIINPNNPDDFMMWQFDKEGNPMYPLPEGYVVDDTPIEDSYSNIISRREQPTESDSGDSDRMIDPRDSAGMTLPRADEFADPDQYLGSEFGLFEDGKPIRLQKTTLDNLKSEYETLKAIRPELTFQEYYNLPTYDKVRFSLRSTLGRDPSNAEIQNAITQAQKSPTGLLSFLNPVISTIKSILSPSADIGGKIDPAFEKTRRERDTAVRNLTNLTDPRKASPYGDAKGVVSEADYQRYKRDTELQSQAMLPSTGKVGKVDDFLLGVRRDPTGKKPPTIFKGNRNPDGSPKYEPLTTDVLSRLEKNRREATDPQKALDRMQEQAAALRPDIQQAEESAGRGDLDTVAQNEAFNEQMREAEAIARGTPRSPSRGGGGQRTTSDFGASSYANEFTGLGSGPSIPDFDRVYVGGVPTKPMKPQRLKKGGIALPKAKPKKMKKGGLASSRKK